MQTVAKLEQKDLHKNPREQDNLGIMVCFCNKYSLGDKTDLKSDDFKEWNEMKSYLVNEIQAEVILPLYLYDHSGIWMGTSTCYPFNNRWDAAQIGFIYVTKIRLLNKYGKCDQEAKNLARKVLSAEVDAYSRYISGGRWHSL